jgi:opacity protein-like surface antigen
MKNVLNVLTLLAVFAVCAFAPQSAQAQSKKEVPAVMEKDGMLLFTALKMSSKDQKALMSILKSEKNTSGFLVNANSKRGNRSYGKLRGADMKVKSILEGEISKQASATCHTVSTDNNCYTINTVVNLKSLSSESQAAIKDLVSSYMK